ncbi:MAG: 5-formyltetrahydrofolate cyclo-ligase [Oscillibacter sp.]
MTKQEEKQQLRAAIRALIPTLPAAYTTAADASIAAHLLAMPEYQAAKTLFCFVGTPREIDTRPILEAALAAGKALCVPLCTGVGIMELRRIFSLSELVSGAYGILEPTADCPLVDADEVDLSVLPCLSCNRLDQRLGQGGKFYDRFLSAYRGGMVLLCREKCMREELPVEPHDYPVPWVITEKGLYEDGIPARLG